MNKKYRYLACFLLCIFSIPVSAGGNSNRQEDDYVEKITEITKDLKSEACTKPKPTDGLNSLFQPLEMASLAHAVDFCERFSKNGVIPPDVVEKLERDIVTQLRLLPVEAHNLGFDPKVVDHAIELVHKLKDISFSSSLSIYSCDDNDNWYELKIGTGVHGCGNNTFYKTEKKQVDDMLEALNKYKVSKLNKLDANYFSYLNQLTTDWERYIKKSKTQTSLEMTVQFGLFGGENGGYFKRPPSWQLIFLRPTPVYEYTWDADKGSREDVSLAFEILGAHAWDGIGWFPPVGLSAGILYTDREGVESNTPTVMLHTGNKYSIGYAKRDTKDGGDSIYVTFDLLSFFVDKEKRMDKIKSKF